VLRYGTYPFVVVGALTGAMLLLDANVPSFLVLVIVSVFAAMVTSIVERLRPMFTSWNESKGDVVTDAVSAGVVLVVVARLIEPLALAVVFYLSQQLSGALGFMLWPTQWPPLAQAALALFVGEFFYYWTHRWIHQATWAWPFHAVHHSSERLYWLNAVRFHPVDFLIDDCALVVPLTLTGWTLTNSGFAGLILLLTFYNSHGVTMHSNMDVRLGPLNYLVPGPEMHRWHHSRDLSEANSNFGGKVMVWDLLFRTYFRPADRLPPELVGLADDVEMPTSYVGLLMMAPFRWSKLQRQAPAPEAQVSSVLA